MRHQTIEIICPACRADLRTETSDRLRCVACRRLFPVVLGIPDLRLQSDPYITIEEDRARAIDLHGRLEGLSFRDSVEVYYRLTPKVPARQARQFKRGLASAVPRAEAVLGQWEATADGSSDRLLDVGCGTAPLLVIAHRRYRQVVGLDLALRWLVMGKKRLADAGVDAPLICGSAEALPFPDDTYQRVVADSVIENVSDQTLMLAECHRVLRPQGYLYVSTPNRFSLGPDPHVPLWMGGYLPPRIIDAYARRLGGLPPRRRLLSWRGLRRLIVAAGFGEPMLFLPEVAAGHRRELSPWLNRLIDVYDIIKRLSGGRRALLWFGPHLLASAAKPAALVSPAVSVTRVGRAPSL